MAMVAAMLIWGISWPSAKITGRYADPELIMIWRFIFAAATMTSIMFFIGIKSKFPKKSLSYVIIAAIFLVGYNYNYFKGTQIGMASLGGIIDPTMSPLVTYIFVFKIFGKTIHRKEVAGIILGMIGGLILLRFWEFKKKIDPNSKKNAQNPQKTPEFQKKLQKLFQIKILSVHQ